MTWTSPIAAVRAWFGGSCRRFGQGRTPRPRFRPSLEALEHRLLLSTTAAPTYILQASGAAGFANPAAVAPLGFTPAQIRHAYGFDQIPAFGGVGANGAGQTIAIVDAFDDPNFVNTLSPAFVNSDLHKFDLQFGLPDPPSFLKIAQDGSQNYPPVNAGWCTEIALDVEWAHAMAPQANILLVESKDATFANLFAAVTYAKQVPGVSAVSMSFGGGEFAGETAYDNVFTTPNGHAGVTFLASSGDSAAPGGYPAFSDNVVAVGGTSLYLSGGNYSSESGWSGSGGGVSVYEPHPAFQNGVTAAGKRESPDVSFVADPNTGVAVYDSYNGGNSPWFQVGGTSVACPCFAGLVAIANQGRAAAGLGSLDGVSQTLPKLYSVSAGDFHDVTTGNNGFPAGPGYDMVTGRGSPVANLLVHDLVGNNVAPVPSPFRLDRSGNLIQTVNGVSTTIDVNVETFSVTSNGTVYDLTNAGVFRERVGASWTTIDTSVQWICASNTGTLYWLEKDGNLWRWQGGGAFLQNPQGQLVIDTNVETIALRPNDGALFDLERGGQLREYANNSLSIIDNNVQQLAMTPDGSIYYLKSGAQLWANQGNGWVELDAGVKSITTTPDGSLYELKQSGNLYVSMNAGPWSLIGNNVQYFGATADGVLYELQNTTVFGNNGSGWYQVDVQVAAFYATLGGPIYELKTNGTFQGQSLQTTTSIVTIAGPFWVVLDQNVQAIGVTYNGTLYDLEQNGNLRGNYYGTTGWFQVDANVKQFAATLSGTLYDLQSNGYLYCNPNQTGNNNWSLVGSQVSFFILNNDGSVTIN